MPRTILLVPHREQIQSAISMLRVIERQIPLRKSGLVGQRIPSRFSTSRRDSGGHFWLSARGEGFLEPGLRSLVAARQAEIAQEYYESA